MSTTHHVRLFQAKNGDSIERSMNDWLKSNRECQFTKFINVDTPTTWSILATVDCRDVRFNHNRPVRIFVNEDYEDYL